MLTIFPIRNETLFYTRRNNRCTAKNSGLGAVRQGACLRRDKSEGMERLAQADVITLECVKYILYYSKADMMTLLCALGISENPCKEC